MATRWVNSERMLSSTRSSWTGVLCCLLAFTTCVKPVCLPPVLAESSSAPSRGESEREEKEAIQTSKLLASAQALRASSRRRAYSGAALAKPRSSLTPVEIAVLSCLPIELVSAAGPYAKRNGVGAPLRC